MILCTFLMSALCGLGMIRFEVKDSSEPIWVPQDSDVLAHERWVDDKFPNRHRYNFYLLQADNILEPETLKEVHADKLSSISQTAYNHYFSSENMPDMGGIIYIFYTQALGHPIYCTS